MDKSQLSTPVADRSEPRILPAKWDGRASFRVREVAEIIQVTKFAVYDMIERGDLPVISLGKTKRVPRHVLERMFSV